MKVSKILPHGETCSLSTIWLQHCPSHVLYRCKSTLLAVTGAHRPEGALQQPCSLGSREQAAILCHLQCTGMPSSPPLDGGVHSKGCSLYVVPASRLLYSKQRCMDTRYTCT